ncbi:MAG: C45 family autoproteolytic acyltransferase/hydrolase [Planctomycetaceae bacterium]
MSRSPLQDSYPLFHASGSARELGRAHGEQAAEKIRAYLESLQQSLKVSRETLRTRALAFRPLFAKFCPHLLEEIDGLAEGASIDPADALAVQFRGELGQLRDEACTTFVVGPRGTADGQILIGQTSDTPPEIEDYGYVLHLVPDDRPEVLMWSFGGMIGYHGVNDRGVAHFANALGGGPAWKFALSHYPIKRMMLEQSSVSEVVALLRSVPVCSNGNYVLCEGSGNILDVELTSDGPNLIDDDGAGFIAHSNHFLCAAHACEENFAQGLPDSFPRLERMRSLIRAKFGSITVDDMKAMLSDHAGHPTSICRHAERSIEDAQTGMSVLPKQKANPMLGPEGKTVAALIAEPSRGVLHVVKGNPCEHPFVAYPMT